MANASDLLELSTVLVTGSDARKFLQGQLTNDVRTLSAERALLSGVTTAQGRVLALATLVERPEGIIVVLPAALTQAIVERWRAHVLNAKVCLEVGRWVAAGMTAPAEAGPGAPPQTPGECRHRDDQSLLRWWGVGERYLLLAPSPSSASGGEASPSLCLEWRRADLVSGIPHVQPATQASFIPQMLNLDLIGAVSFGKGCYVGQEVVARAQRSGISRRMRRFVAACPPPALGARVVDGEGVAGEVVDAVSSGSGSDVLVVLDLDKVGCPLWLEGEPEPLEPAALPYSVPLERVTVKASRL
jgi:folate-binding protein YgfZ